MTTSSQRTSDFRILTRIGIAASAATLFSVTVVTGAGATAEPLLSNVTAPSVGDFVDGTLPCTPPYVAALGERRQRIADAPTVEEARDLAITPARAARRALQVAGLVAPSNDEIAAARVRLQGYEARVEQSGTPAAVAGEFGRLLDLDMRSGNLVQVADLSVGQASVRGPGKCHYSTGEIVAIVFGFILFIIPGIILLIVLC